MIVTVTLNPALDLTYRVDALVPHGTHRVAAVAERPGGKGINVAAALRTLGEPVLATGLLGGATGGRVTDLLAGEGLPAAFVPIAGETRRTVVVADHDDATGFWEPGPQVTAGEWAAFVAHFRDLLGGAAGGRELADAGAALALGARAVVVSRGPRGVVALTTAGAWRGVPPERIAGNPTGAGDACVAALARGLRDQTPWPDLVADAVALSAAAVAAPSAGAVDRDTYRRLLPAVRVSAA